MNREKLQKYWSKLRNSPNERQAIYLGFAVLFIAAIVLRASLIKFESGDYPVFGQWYDFIKAHGIHSFKYGFSNYTAPYLYVLYICSILPLSKIVAIKCSMIVFDFVLAAAVYLIVKHFRGTKHYLPVIAALVCLFLPTVFVNSAMWGQIDASYTAFTLLSLYFALKNKSRLTWIFFGVAIAIKFQAIFFLPVLAFLTFRRIRWYEAYWSILVFVGLVFPPLFIGRPITELFKIYLEQSKQFSGILTLSAPNIYQWVPNSTFQYFNQAGIILAGSAVVLAVLVGLIYKKHSDKDILVFSTLILFIIPFLLPQMHERYFFTAEVLCLLVAFCYPKYSWTAGLMQLITFFSYSPFLFAKEPVPFPILSFGVLIIISSLAVLYMKPEGVLQKLPKLIAKRL